MNNDAKRKFVEGKRIHRSTHLPSFFLRIKGKFDSKKPPATAQAYIEKLKDRCFANANSECVIAEELLKSDRKEAIESIAAINNDKAILCQPSFSGTANSAELRVRDCQIQKKSAAQESIRLQSIRLCALNESIINIDCCLEERIQKTQNFCAVAVHSYVKGLRSGGLDYPEEIDFSPDRSLQTYHAKHATSDQLIQAFVKDFLSFYNQIEEVS